MLLLCGKKLQDHFFLIPEKCVTNKKILATRKKYMDDMQKYEDNLSVSYIA